MATKIWDNNHVIGEVLVSEKVKSVVCASTRDGIRYINIRHWYQKKDGTWMPSMDGVTFAINARCKDNSLVPDPTDTFIKLIQSAKDELVTMPLYDEANAVYRKEK